MRSLSRQTFILKGLHYRHISQSPWLAFSEMGVKMETILKMERCCFMFYDGPQSMNCASGLKLKKCLETAVFTLMWMARYESRQRNTRSHIFIREHTEHSRLVSLAEWKYSSLNDLFIFWEPMRFIRKCTIFFPDYKPLIISLQKKALV